MVIVRNRGNDASIIDKSQDNSRLPITPSDVVKQPVSFDALFVDVAGDVVVDDGNGGQVTLSFDVGGPYFVGGISYVYATGTTATGLVGVASKALR